MHHRDAERAERVIASDAKTETLVSLRDTLLPKLISGELRIASGFRHVGAET